MNCVLYPQNGNQRCHYQKTSTKNHVIMISSITTLANAPLKNPINEPIDAMIASLKDFSWSISTINTTTNGMTITPNGGIINDPTITATAALRSPHLLPPNFFTK